jgi:hypothetical protein
MRQKVILFVLWFINSNISVFSQVSYSKNDLKGIWKYRNSIESEGRVNNQYLLMNNQNYLILEVNTKITNDSYFYYFNNIIENFGFISKDDTAMVELKNSGLIGEDFLVLSNNYEFEINNNILELYNSNFFYYEKVENIPNNLVVALFFISKKIKRDLIKEHLDKKYLIIKKSKSIIHKIPDKPTKMYLLKNDPVEVIEEKYKWLKIKYYPEKNGEWTGKTIEGWVKKSDIE